MKSMMRQKRGVAGLTILLTLVVFLFVIGLLITIFVLMSGRLADTDSLYIASSGAVVNESLASVDATGEYLAAYTRRDVVCTITTVQNSSDGTVINSGNYTQTNCLLVNATTEFDGYDWNVTYGYTFLADTGAVAVINATSSAIGDTTDWFGIFIVIACMVVLILLTIIIITAIRSSGMIGGGQATSSPSKVGSA